MTNVTDNSQSSGNLEPEAKKDTQSPDNPAAANDQMQDTDNEQETTAIQ